MRLDLIVLVVALLALYGCAMEEQLRIDRASDFFTCHYTTNLDFNMC